MFGILNELRKSTYMPGRENCVCVCERERERKKESVIERNQDRVLEREGK
jgi:hypothetical protein